MDKNNPNLIFSKALRYYLSITGKSQQDLCKDLNISSSTMSQWVNGKMFPRMDKVELLAKYFNITTTDLMRDPNDNLAELSSSDPIFIVKLMEKNQLLYDLFCNAIELEDEDIALVNTFVKRLSK